MLQVITHKWGDRYNDKYVHCLERGLARKLKVDHDFSLFQHMNNSPFLKLPGLGWPKLTGYRNDVEMEGFVLMMDLDLVILDDFSEEIHWGMERLAQGVDLIGMEKWHATHQKYPLNSSMVLFRAGHLHFLCADLEKEYEACTDEERHNEEKYTYAVLTRHGYNIDYWPRGTIGSMRRHVLADGKRPSDFKIVSFNGKLKQEHYNEAWIDDNWREE